MQALLNGQKKLEFYVLQIVSVFALCPILIEVNIQNVVEIVFNSPLTSNGSGTLFCDMGIQEVQGANIVAIKRTDLAGCLANALSRSFNDRAFIEPYPLLQ